MNPLVPFAKRKQRGCNGNQSIYGFIGCRCAPRKYEDDVRVGCQATRPPFVILLTTEEKHVYLNASAKM